MIGSVSQANIITRSGVFFRKACDIMSLFHKIYIAALTVAVVAIICAGIPVSVYCFMLLLMFSALVFFDKIESLRIGDLMVQLRKSAVIIDRNMAQFNRLNILTPSSEVEFPVIDIEKCRSENKPEESLSCLSGTLEETFRDVCEKWDYKGPTTLPKMVRFLKDKNRLSWYIYDSISQVLKTIKKARGVDMKSMGVLASETMALVERINENTQPGYSLNIGPNSDYEAQDLFCEYEHCIEMMPLAELKTGKSCPEFGHDCPGGEKQVKRCKKAGRF